MQFLGEVQAVDSQRKKITVKHGAIRGYALRGTDIYSVANESIITRLRPGDDIRAIVYPNDDTLYKVEIVNRSGAGKKSSE